MLKILNTTQIKALDDFTIRHEPITSVDLMERACHAFVSWFTLHFDVENHIGIVCGTGNNGGDGLGIARLLKDWGYSITVWVVRGTAPETEDFRKNLERIQGKTDVLEIQSQVAEGIFTDQDVLIDAIFGSGLSRPAEGIYAQVIKSINSSKAIRVSVDIPSGLMADKPSAGEIAKADYTITFQLPKLSFFLPTCGMYTGKWRIVNIGLHEVFIQKTDSTYFLLEKTDIQSILRQRSKYDHKGNFGHALLIAGSFGKMGAAILAARAAMRSGAGLLTVHVPSCGYEIMQTAVPEAMASVDPAERMFSTLPNLESYSAIGTGPGIGMDKQTVKVLTALLESAGKPVVLDADAINILGANRELIHLIPKGSILTPHPKEFERLVGTWNSDFERLEKQLDFSKKTDTIVIVKGAHSSISTPGGRILFNQTGNPGMATGGSGDVLTGLVTGLLAQGYTSEESAVLAVWIHGLAGDCAAAQKGQEALIASDLVDYIPQAFIQSH